MRFAALMLALCLAIPALAAPATRPTRAEMIQQYTQLRKDLVSQFGEKDYAAAEATCRKMLEMAPRDTDTNYNLACALARQGKTDAALDAMKAATDGGYDDAQHAREDDDLAALRNDKRFEALLARAEQMDGVKTLSRNPEGGLAYRLRMSPTATKEKPNRLVVWLHPSGGSMNNVVEKMAPELAKHGFALMTFPGKQFAGWADEEAQRLMDKSLPDAAKIDGIDTKRPILLGFSAGGQMALLLWKEQPGRFGGLVLDAAYPVDNSGQKQIPLLPPDDKATNGVPVLVVVGEADQGGAGWDIWKKNAPAWLKAGVPLTIEHVPDGQHQWLFDADRTKLLMAWLDDVSAGKLPSADATTRPAEAGTTTRPIR